MRSPGCVRPDVACFLAFAASCAMAAAAAGQPAGRVPARYAAGGLPPLPVQAVGGGEVLLELAVGTDGRVGAVRTLRATPPFTDVMREAVRSWRFTPAEEGTPLERAGGGETRGRTPVASTVIVAGMFRPPALDAPTFAERPVDLARPAEEAAFPLATVMPPYPPLARDSGIVLVEVHVNARGQAVDATAIRQSPPFDEPALAAARRWTFRPARADGIAVDTLVYIVFGFRQPVIAAPGRGQR